MSSLAAAGLLAERWFSPGCTDARSQLVRVGGLAAFGPLLPACLAPHLRVERGSWGRGIWGRQFVITCDLCSCVVFQEAYEALGAPSRYWQ